MDVTTLDEVELEDEAGGPGRRTRAGYHAGAGGVRYADQGERQGGHRLLQHERRLCDGQVYRFHLQAAQAQLKGPTTTYTYNITAGKWETFPLSDGNGSYQVIVYENISGSKYSTVLSASFTASMTDEFAPFLRPNQYVDYENAPNTVAKAKELTAGMTDPLQKVKAVYDFVVSTLSYDKQLAATVQSGYLAGAGFCSVQQEGHLL